MFWGLFLNFFFSDLICDRIRDHSEVQSAVQSMVQSAIWPSPSGIASKFPQNDDIGQMDSKNQARSVCFLYFIQKSNILIHRKISSIVILNSIQCFTERSQQSKVLYHTAHFRHSHHTYSVIQVYKS